MQIGLLGNGFDLNHKLPTKYINFLHTIQYLEKYYTEEDGCIGKVFGAETLQKIDRDIAGSYAQFAEVYNEIPLPKEQINQLIKEAKQNLWYKYFSRSLDKELNWIDFEKEIGRVIDTLSRLLDTRATYFYIGTKKWSDSDRYIIRSFPLFYDKTDVDGAIGYGKRYDIKRKYISEYPYGSKEKIVDINRIISDLYLELRKLAEMLKTYLVCFIDGLTDRLHKMKYYPELNLYSQLHEVYTFNYTNTVENLYGTQLPIEHIHGSTEGDIVLGVNPDEKDELTMLDTSFIQYKKYYQRVFFRTDNNYLDNIKDLRNPRRTSGEIILHVVGHSLDITDKDIIEEIFDVSNKIFIYYYCEEDVGKYIRNLIQIYGKSSFDKIRSEKGLAFLPLRSIQWKNN